MPRPKKQNTHLKKARQEASATCTVPVDVAAGFRTAPELTLQAPTKLAAHRGSTARSCQVQSHRNWKFVCANFHLFDLRHGEGTEADCEDDYGGFHANFKFPTGLLSSDAPWGVVVRGTPAYDKKGRNNKEHICANSKQLTPLLHAIFSSLGVALQMQLIKPRVVALRGLTSLWHTDTNPRGANPVACRPLDAGGGLLLYTGVPFRICFILFRKEWVIPLDLTPSAFRVIRKGVDGDALVVPLSRGVFWEEVVHGRPGGPKVLGSFGGSVISMKGRDLLICPLDHVDIGSGKHGFELDVLCMSDALARAACNLIEASPHTWRVICANPGKWDVWHGWKHPHTWIGDPWCRRLQVTGCPYRQNGAGQNRSCDQELDVWD